MAWTVLAASSLLSGLGLLGCTPNEPVARGLEVQRAEIGLMPGDGPAVAYLTVANGGAQDDRLVAVTTPFAAQAEMHESVDELGVVKMIARPEGFVIPAGGALELEPGGKHIMLFGPRSEVIAEGRVPLALRFEHQGPLEVQADVVRVGGGQHAGMDHGEMDHGEMDHGEMEQGTVGLESDLAAAPPADPAAHSDSERNEP